MSQDQLNQAIALGVSALWAKPRQSDLTVQLAVQNWKMVLGDPGREVHPGEIVEAAKRLAGRPGFFPEGAVVWKEIRKLRDIAAEDRLQKSLAQISDEVKALPGDVAPGAKERLHTLVKKLLAEGGSVMPSSDRAQGKRVREQISEFKETGGLG